MERRYMGLALVTPIILVATAACSAEVYLNATAATESGAPLAKGNCRVVTVEEEPKGANLPSTMGHSNEPGAMYMLLSYVTAPTPWLLNFWASGARRMGDSVQRLEERGDWSTRANTTLESVETVAVPGGTFTEALKYRTAIAGAQVGSEAAETFVNGTRFLWFAKGIGLVRMRYEHANGKVTEAVLLSHGLTERGDSYLPLQVGNRWTYAWKNAYRPEAVIETWQIGDRPEDRPSLPTRQRSGSAVEVKTVDPNSVMLDLSQDTWIKIAVDPGKGFHFPYYLFIPKGMDPAADRHLLVETNNTGTASDDFQVHDDAAARLVRDSHATRIARELGTPLLVPVFPRPRDQWQAYTHSLDEDTLLIASGPLKRIDLQLIQMIRDAQALLRRNRVHVQDKVFMHGYSASGVFANRFPVLHPEVVRAVATGGVNAIPIFPMAQWQGTTLPFPVGIADLKKITGINRDEPAYRQVSQYIYMGYLDRNDTTLSRDTFCEEHAKLIRTLIGAEMPDRWKVSQSIYHELSIPAQCVTYNGSGHEIKPEMIEDIIRFFRANSKDGFVPIQPHEYPFVESREIKTADVNGLYWQGDKRIPEWCRNLFDGKGHFIICIDEWMAGQDHQQLDAFQHKVAFRFLLKAEGHEDVKITEQDVRGNCSGGRGEFQGFVVALPSAELSKLASGVAYTLVPVYQRDEYRWQVKAGVQLVRP